MPFEFHLSTTYTNASCQRIDLIYCNPPLSFKHALYYTIYNESVSSCVTYEAKVSPRDSSCFMITKRCDGASPSKVNDAVFFHWTSNTRSGKRGFDCNNELLLSSYETCDVKHGTLKLQILMYTGQQTQEQELIRHADYLLARARIEQQQEE